MNNFTPISALLGGGLIGVSASLLLIANGRVAGISGILAGLLSPARQDVLWRVMFVVGLLIAGAVLVPGTVSESPRSLPIVLVAGLLVGVGTRLGNGCTSGHGVCGISRFSARSIVATLTFITAGMLVVRALAQLGGQ
jgi:uncharacterized membrane protein YedE/YeeE